MMRKTLMAVFFVLLLAQAFATVEVTFNTPTDGTTYNNLWQRYADINFNVTDDNASFEQLIVNIKYFDSSTHQVNGTPILVDGNLLDFNTNPTGAATCIPSVTGSTAFSCKILWTLPAHSAMGDSKYWIDVNVTDAYDGGTGVYTWNADDNATNYIIIDTHLSTAQATRDLMAIVGLILAGVVLLAGLTGIVYAKLDPMKTAIITIVSAIAVAIAAQIIGTVLALL